MRKFSLFKTFIRYAIFLLAACSRERDSETQPLSGLNESIRRNAQILGNSKSMTARDLYSFSVNDRNYHLVHVTAIGETTDSVETEITELLIMRGDQTIAHQAISGERKLKLLDLDRDGTKEIISSFYGGPAETDFDGMEIFEISSGEFKLIHKSNPDFRPTNSNISVQHSFGYNKKTNEIKDIFRYSPDECFVDFLFESKKISIPSEEFREVFVYKYSNKQFTLLRSEKSMEEREHLNEIVKKFGKGYQAADWECGC